MLTMEHLSCWFSLNRGRGWTASGRTSCYPSSPFLSPIPHIWLVFPTTTCLSMFIASQPLWVNVYCQSTTLYRKLKESNPSEPNPVGQTASAAVSQPQSHQDLTVDAAPSSWWVQSTYCLIEDCDGRSNSLECSKNVQYWTLSVATQMWSDLPDCCCHCCWFELCSSNHLDQPRAFCTGCLLSVRTDYPI